MSSDMYDVGMNEEYAETIADALARLRGRRGHFPQGRGFHAETARAARGGTAPEMRHGGHGMRGGPALLRLLSALARGEAPLGVGEIGEAIGVDQPRASRLVAQAVETGLVRREVDPRDARRTRVALTEEGRAVVGRFREAQRDGIAIALEGFSAAEQEQLARLLTRLADAWPRE